MQVSDRNICLKQTKIYFDFKLGRKGISLIEFDELTLANMEIVYRIEQTEDPEDKAPPPMPQEWIEKLETIPSIRILHMNSKSIRILTSDQELSFDFLLRGHVRAKDMALALELSNLKNHPKWSTKSVVQIELSSEETVVFLWIWKAGPF